MVAEAAPGRPADTDEAEPSGIASDIANGIEDAGPAGIDEAALAELEVRLASASLDLTDRLLHTAFQEMEAAMFEQVSNRLRAELPELVARIIREHFGESS